MSAIMRRLNNTTKKFAYASGETEEIRFQKQLILVVSVCCCFCGLLWGALYYWFLGVGLSMILPWLFVVIVGAAVMLAHAFGNHLVLVYAELICITWITAFIQWSLGSISDSGFVIVWSFLGPIGALIFLDKRQALFWLFQFLSIVLVTVLVEPRLSDEARHATDTYRITFYLMNLCVPPSVVFGAAYYFVVNLIKQKKRSDELLYNILPEQIAEEVKIKGYADATLFENVSVMFTDFKGFTLISEKLSPIELVKEIDFCFSAFDRIISKHNLEKIKTIGDSYMCVGGLPTPDAAHAENVLKAAFEICEFMKREMQKRQAEGKPFFELRIGCHSGPVVAGIVGIKKFAYDIWGDTVNIASRMESGGEPGKVNISGATYELVKSQIKCTYRGKISAKNKGEVDMYFAEQ